MLCRNEGKHAVIYNLTHLDFSQPVSASTQGSVPKAFDGTLFYKVNNFNAVDGFYGYSAMNDVIASRYLRSVGIPSLAYLGMEARIMYEGKEWTTFVNTSLDYRLNGEDVSLESIFACDGVAPEERIDRAKSIDSSYVDFLFSADFLVGNRDRHGSNIRLTGGSFVPLFDFNMSLFMPDGQSRTHDIRANNFLGTSDLMRNLEYVNALPRTCVPDYNKVFEGLQYPYKDELIVWLDERRDMYEKIRSSRS